MLEIGSDLRRSTTSTVPAGKCFKSLKQFEEKIIHLSEATGEKRERHQGTHLFNSTVLNTRSGNLTVNYVQSHPHNTFWNNTSKMILKLQFRQLISPNADWFGTVHIPTCKRMAGHLLGPPVAPLCKCGGSLCILVSYQPKNMHLWLTRQYFPQV